VNGRLDVNVALNRPSYQVSTFITPGVGSQYASYANDGNRWTTLWQAPYCIATNSSTNPWWAVDLGVKLYVWGVNFTNRADCCGTFLLFLPH